MEIVHCTEQEWNERGEQLFGQDKWTWKFKCPLCGYIATAQDYKDAGAPQGAIGFSCIGRWLPNPKKAIFTKDLMGNGPCDYAGGGLFCFNPLHVHESNGKVHEMFDFAEVNDVATTNESRD